MGTSTPPTTTLPAIAFIGAGNMGSAIIAGLQALPSVPAITVVDRSPAIRERHQASGCTTSDQLSAASNCPVVVLAVKPQVAAAVMADLAPQRGQLVISIMAGITLTQMAASLPADTGLIRAMPNTPMAIGQGMTGLAPSATTSPEHIAIATAIFAAAGEVLVIDESQMDGLTAISGSGPAYVFAFAEAQLAAAQALGFSPEQAALLVGTTLTGSAAYLASQPGLPATKLREQVTSPGGTTAAALAEFTAADFPTMVSKALHAAAQRSRELSA